MAVPVEMPKLGNTVEDCLLARWAKTKGEAVSEGELIAEIETDKTTFELTAPASGVLLETFAEQGAFVPVYSNIAVIGQPGENVEAFRPGAAVPAEQPRIVPTDTAAVEPEAELKPPAAAALSPRAGRFAREHHFDAAGVPGTGPGGRVLEQDVREAYLASARRGDGGASLTGIRATIARRMREALATTAQYTLHTSADATGLLAVRSGIKRGRDGSGLTDININELVLFCAVRAVLKMPEVNASLRGGRLHRNEEIHLGFACDTERGLLVPVVRNAHQLTVDELSRRVKALTAEALNGSISPDDLAGATFTVTNLGSLGIESFTPILAPPQVAILGVDTIAPRPVRHGGEVRFVEHIGLSLTCDHQVIDGAPGARFLAILKEQIENVQSLWGGL